RRLTAREPVRGRGVDRRGPGGTTWRVSVGEARLVVLTGVGRGSADARASADMQRRLLTPEQLAAVFARAPARVARWRCLVSEEDESHGETYARLWMLDAGIHFVQQVWAHGFRHDFRVGKRTFVEIDGGQHDPEWTG